ncbi:charged multivesicular body protein 4b-like [Saccostrea echinata]|uniref:charged multivesicular body protein 4b-like n=1 Tax=Saccostrea echinata TaxID=191078 RepID=UPI002A803EDD|nr:charged multivesicular body protein 4b-like [Saccostrea echinata]
MASKFWSRFWGKESENVSTEQAIQKLRDLEDLLNKKSVYLEENIQQETEKARSAGFKNKRVALKALKKKKNFEKQLTEVDNTLSTIELQREDLENVGTTSTVLQVMKTAKEALQKANLKLDVDKIQNLMEDIEEQRELAREAQEALSMRIGPDDDDELEEELRQMMEEEEVDDLTKELMKLGPVPVKSVDDPFLPDEGSKVHRKKSKGEEDDGLRELAAWAN